MWSDNEANVDLLGYQHLVGAITSILDEERLLPATVGVFGDWGSGKSTLIQMVRAEVEKDKETLVLSFNGWLFEGYDDAKLALMGTIVDELVDRKKLTVRGKELVLGLVKRINGWRLLLAGGRAAAMYYGADADGIPDFSDFTEAAKDVKPEDLGKFLREKDPGQQLRRGVREFRKDFTELLGDSKVKRLVVIVDDLDRCSPDTIIETLEAIKLFLFVPRTAFVIGADERLIRYAVRRRFPELPGERAEVGRDYLEKLIQFPVRIPAMGRGETETYIKLLLAERCILKDDSYDRLRECGIAADASVDATLDRASVLKVLGAKPEQDLDEALTLGDQISGVLASGLAGNPRQCKRFLNTLLMRLGMAASRKVALKRRTLAKLMLLEYMKPESFKELARLQAAQSGRPHELAALERPVAAEAERATDEDKQPPSKTPKAVPKPSIVRATSDSSVGALATWQSDDWLTAWVAAEPALAEEDLRPYFYFAREKLDPLAGLALRMSPEAQTAVAKLLSPSTAERTVAITRASQLSQADAAAVFEALARRTRETETLTMTDGSLPRMFDWVEARTELFGEFIAFLKSLPETTVPFGIAARMPPLGATPEKKLQVSQLLEHWKLHGSAQLKRTAATALEQMKKQ